MKNIKTLLAIVLLCVACSASASTRDPVMCEIEASIKTVRAHAKALLQYLDDYSDPQALIDASNELVSTQDDFYANDVRTLVTTDRRLE